MSKPIIKKAPDGNVFAIIGAVAMALRRAKQTDKEKDFVSKAYKSESYEDVLTLTTKYVTWAFADEDNEEDFA